MKTNQKFNELREACVKANPEAARTHIFSEGSHRCKFCGQATKAIVEAFKEKGIDICPMNPHRSITVADVLLALNERYNKVSREMGFLLEEEKEDWRDAIIELALTWDHRNDDLFCQSKKTVESVHSLIFV